MLIINIGGVGTKPPRVAGIIKIQPTQKLNSSCAYAFLVCDGKRTFTHFTKNVLCQ
jgi:hypothetical protein